MILRLQKSIGNRQVRISPFDLPHSCSIRIVEIHFLLFLNEFPDGPSPLQDRANKSPHSLNDRHSPHNWLHSPPKAIGEYLMIFHITPRSSDILRFDLTPCPQIGNINSVYALTSTSRKGSECLHEIHFCSYQHLKRVITSIEFPRC